MRLCSNEICPDEQTNERTNAMDGQPENIILSPTLSGGAICAKLETTYLAIR